jgi:acyl transferase domain-containing protein
MRQVGLLFAGQGAQHRRMAAGLYGHEPVFTAAMDEVFDLYGAEGDGLRADWLADPAPAGLHGVGRAQPLLFAVGHALGRMVLSWGVRPAALLGHSVGEIAAATLAGVFRVADAVALLRDRARCARLARPGGMLAVSAGVAEVRPWLPDGVVVGAVNAPRQTVLAGLDGPLAEAADRLRGRGYACRRVPCPVAFHSPAVAHLAADTLPLLASLPLRAPTLPLYSGYAARRVDARTATDPRYWVGHAVEPVLFWPALDGLLAGGDLVLLDTSPGRALTVAARRHPAVAAGTSDVVPLLPARPGPGYADRRDVLAAAGRLRAAGHRLAGPAPAQDRVEADSSAPSEHHNAAPQPAPAGRAT